MKQKNVNLSRKIVQDITMWTILIFSLLILNSSKVFGQCNCDDEQVTTVSLGASEGFESYNACLLYTSRCVKETGAIHLKV